MLCFKHSYILFFSVLPFIFFSFSTNKFGKKNELGKPRSNRYFIFKIIFNLKNTEGKINELRCPLAARYLFKI